MSRLDVDVPELVRRFVRTESGEALEQLRLAPARSFRYVASLLRQPDLAVAECDDQRECFTRLIGLAIDLGEIVPDVAFEELDRLPGEAELSMAEILAGMTDARVVPRLLSLSRSRKETTRWAAVHGLAPHHRREVTERIVETLRDRSLLVRRAAVESLFGRGESSAATELRARAIDWRRSDPALARRASEIADLLELGLGGARPSGVD